MNRATPELRRVAERLMAYETNGGPSSDTETPAGFPAFEKLRPHLATLMGVAGFRGLLSRSLALAGEEVRWLRAVHVTSDGTLTELPELQAQLAPAQFAEGRTVLLAQLLGLLVAFIGEVLTARLVHEAWPDLSHSDLNFGRGDKQ